MTPFAAEERVTELEVKIAFQDDLLDALNSIVIRQQNEIDELREHLKALIETVNNMHLSAAAGRPEQEIPPHY